MAIQSSDLKFLLSGGSSNTDINASIGGVASVQIVIPNARNNIFDNVQEDETAAGHTDYRCLYLKNANATDSAYNTRVYIVSQITGASSIWIGTYFTTELQRLTIDGLVTGGTMALSYDGDSTIDVSWGASEDEFKVNLETALNDLSALGGISIPVASYTGSAYYFDIYFEGVNDNRAYPALVIQDDSLTGSTSSNVARTSSGGPINTVASKLDFDTIAPFGVSFYQIEPSAPLEIGTLFAGDQFPLWIKRVTPGGLDEANMDGVVLGVKVALAES